MYFSVFCILGLGHLLYTLSNPLQVTVVKTIIWIDVGKPRPYNPVP